MEQETAYSFPISDRRSGILAAAHAQAGLAMLETCHRHPRGAGIRRSFSDGMIAPIVVIPSA
jgi:hypothetical protein